MAELRMFLAQDQLAPNLRAGKTIGNNLH